MIFTGFNQLNCRDGANYQLRYQLVAAPDADPVASAIAAFEQSSQPFSGFMDVLIQVTLAVKRQLYQWPLR
ncbi:hypothetical protein ACQ4N7_25730 [Nodosilinea sp. AN01ver1]|uniref:hypothetical protein n=1 Tax=Nodosilinea sp. AN01ver1 TaxID=3423362 RepID=UPI003D31E3F4